jgi:hypothetical protein
MPRRAHPALLPEPTWPYISAISIDPSANSPDRSPQKADCLHTSLGSELRLDTVILNDSIFQKRPALDNAFVADFRQVKRSKFAIDDQFGKGAAGYP